MTKPFLLMILGNHSFYLNILLTWVSDVEIPVDEDVFQQEAQLEEEMAGEVFPLIANSQDLHQEDTISSNLFSASQAMTKDDYSYFDPKLLKNWAGPNHWKFQKPSGIKRSLEEANGDEVEQVKPKRKRKKKEPFLIDFLLPLDKKVPSIVLPSSFSFPPVRRTISSFTKSCNHTHKRGNSKSRGNALLYFFFSYSHSFARDKPSNLFSHLMSNMIFPASLTCSINHIGKFLLITDQEGSEKNQKGTKKMEAVG